MNQKNIARTMTIEEILGGFPQKSQKLAQEITDSGLHCVGCQASTWETLEAGMLGHGFEEQEIDALVERLNAILDAPLNLEEITITAAAATKFRELAVKQNKASAALRFGDKPGGCSGFEYTLQFSAQANDDDTIFQIQGLEVHVAKKSLHRLLGCEIDFIEGLEGSGFKISNPNAKGSCGCGKSQNY
jgi:iron-sulfur cluster assembly protein